MSTFLELQTEVLAHGFDSTAYLTRVKAWLNEGYKDIIRRFDLEAMSTSSTANTVAGTDTITLPADFAKGISLEDTELDEDLAYASVKEIEQQDDSTRGRPRAYCIDGSTLKIWPVPDAAYALKFRYHKSPTALSADADLAAIPADYHNLLVEYACSKAFRAEDDYEACKFWREEYERDIARMASDVQFSVEDGPTQVAGMWQPTRSGTWS